jgi:hypothetical protein
VAPPAGENVTITLNGATQTATIQSVGSFTGTFATSSLATGTYGITYSYGGDSNFAAATDTSTNLTVVAAVPDLTITKSHTGNFTQGQTGATYTITVSNIGGLATTGLVTVTDTLPTGLTATSIAGTGWSCVLGTLTCTRSDTVAAFASYSAITVTVNVASNAGASVTNTAAVSGGGEVNTANDTATDVTTITPACAAPPSGLVSWWPGDGNTNDFLNANNPSASNAVTFVPAEVGTGFTFGSGGYIDIPASASLANQQFTISAWVRPDGPGPNNDAFGSWIVGQDFDNTHDLYLYWRAADNRFGFEFGSQGSEVIVSQDSFPTGSFYLVSGTYDGTTFKLYVNGTLEGQFAETTTIPYTNNTWTIGSSPANSRNQGYPRTWNGVIDEVQVFNRALSASEIQAIFAADGAGECKAPAVPANLTLVSGDGQTGTVGQALVQPLVVKLTNQNQNPISGSPITFAIGAGAGTLTGGVSSYAAAVLADRPVAYYRLGEVPGSTIAVDSSGAGNNGTYENGPTLRVPGLISNTTDTAVNFATGDVVIPDAANLDFVNAPFTIEAWVSGTYPGGNQRVFDKSAAGTGIGYGLDLGADNVRLLGCTNFAPPVTLSGNTTYHVVGVSDGAGTGSIYVNGSLVMSGPYSSCQPYTGTAHIAVANDGTAHFDGTIDEVAVYNYALPAQRISAHYNLGIGSVLNVNTDAEGLASVTLNLGPAAGTDTVTATANGYASSPITFTAAAIGAITASGGNNQVGAVGTTLASPLTVTLTGADDAPIPSWPVVFAIVPNCPAVASPVENLHPIAAPVREHQQVAGVRVAADDVLGQHRQPVKRAAYVARHRTQVHLDRRRETQHRGGSRAVRTARNLSSSTPRRMRNFRPSPSTSSMPASVAPASSLTRAKLAGLP